jgi:Dyp-type peroxidase family
MTEQAGAPTTDSGKTPFERDEELKDVQGGVIGFNKDHMRLVYVDVADADSGRQFVSALVPQLANGFEVLNFNAVYGDIARRGGDADKVVQATWINLLLSRTGLQALQAPRLEAMPEEFTAGMANRQLGDVGASAPDKWVAPFTGGAEPHIVIMIAADAVEDVEAAQAWVESTVAEHGAHLNGPTQAGDGRPAPFVGHEHFGFKDGISQPGIEHFTKSSKSGAVPAGEVLIGYENADGQISGQPSPTPPPPPSPYDPAPPPPLPQPMPGWTRNASFVVFRRLRQDVASFNAAMADQAPQVSLSPEQLGAKLVGRWPSGAPMERVPGLPRNIDPSVHDPSPGCPVVLENAKINNFDYHDDQDGLRVPRAAHIRKMNPRADALADGDSSTRHRMVRRGITYGPELQPGETPYGEVVPDTQDRGLLFINYQSSISRTFEFVQTRWANRDDFQKGGDGRDPIISQDTPQRSFTLPPAQTMSFTQWVFTTGGAYLIAPSLSGLIAISTPTPPTT